MEIANIGNYKATEDWWVILPAILSLETILILLVRFIPGFFGKSANEWYDTFGMTGVLSDVSIFAITIAIARYIYTVFFMEQEGWSIWYFIALAIIFQVVYDIIYNFGIIRNIPKGHNTMVDIIKEYSESGAKAIITDAAIVAGSIALAATLKNQDYHYIISLFLVTVYTATYSLYTNVK